MTLASQTGVKLAALTTLGVGGPVRRLIEARSEREVIEAVETSRSESLPLLVLGGGSNLLAADRGFDGIALRVAIESVSIDEAPDRSAVRAGAGVEWDRLAAECVRRGFHGVECLGGIPGRVGAAPIQNIGAYGQEAADVILSVRVFDRDRFEMRDLPADACRFGYRSSIFNTSARGRFVIVSVDFGLSRSGRPPLHYPDLARRFAGRSSDPSPAEVREAVLAIRAGKAMLLQPGDPDCRSAGSFFKNPVIGEAHLAEIQARAPARPLPVYPAAPGFRKIPAAWLIEQSGFQRGYVDGAVGLSSRHALALINRGGASAADVLRLAGAIQDCVEERFGVRLVPEPVFVGFPESIVQRFQAVTV